MDDSVEVTRSIELELGPDGVWELIADGERWADWMVDTAAVEVSPGATGDVTDAGERRGVRIDRVEEGRRVAFEWWPADQRDQASSVQLRIASAPEGAVLEIVETFPPRAQLSAQAAATAWRARTRCLRALRPMLVTA